MEIGLSLGSNKGDRLEQLREARLRIGSLANVAITGQSSVYETEPVDVPDEFSDQLFLNAVLLIETHRDPQELLAEFLAIEHSMGRYRTDEENLPRPIDIDIIYADATVLRADDLILPHPRWAERRFVVQPLADLRPHMRLPEQAHTVEELVGILPSDPKVAMFAEKW